MSGVNEAIDRLGATVALVRNHVPLPETWPDPTLLALAGILGGLVLSLWGARCLRGLYVLAFMALGAAIGVKIARIARVDDLIGLVLGTGCLGVLGHLCYRWWVGLTAGVCLTMVVAVIFGVRNLPVIETELQQRFPDHQLGVGTGQYVLGQAAGAGEQARPLATYLADLGTYYWDTRRETAYRVIFVLGLAWLTGMAMGLTLPRFTAILGTSAIGVLAAGLGTALLISSRWPGLWSAMANRSVWLLAGWAVLLAVSLSYQTRHGRTASVIPLAPAAPAS